MRTWINPTRNYMRPVELGEVMRAGGIGRVVLSRSKGLVEGDLVGRRLNSFSHLRSAFWVQARFVVSSRRLL